MGIKGNQIWGKASPRGDTKGSRGRSGKEAIKGRTTYSCQREAKRTTKHDSQQCQPTQAEARTVRKAEERLLDAWDPERGDRASDDAVGDEAEGDNGDEEPRPDGLHDPGSLISTEHTQAQTDGAHHRWRVAVSTVAQIHQASTVSPSASSTGTRKRA